MARARCLYLRPPWIKRQAHIRGAAPDPSGPSTMTGWRRSATSRFAGGDQTARDAVVLCVQDAAKTAWPTRRQLRSRAMATQAESSNRRGCRRGLPAPFRFTRRRAATPRSRIFFNLGKRKKSNEWSALEHRTQFERKMATGILFRVELASRLQNLGFTVEPAWR